MLRSPEGVGIGALAAVMLTCGWKVTLGRSGWLTSMPMVILPCMVCPAWVCQVDTMVTPNQATVSWPTV